MVTTPTQIRPSTPHNSADYAELVAMQGRAALPWTAPMADAGVESALPLTLVAGDPSVTGVFAGSDETLLAANTDGFAPNVYSPDDLATLNPEEEALAPEATADEADPELNGEAAEFWGNTEGYEWAAKILDDEQGLVASNLYNAADAAEHYDLTSDQYDQLIGMAQQMHMYRNGLTEDTAADSDDADLVLTDPADLTDDQRRELIRSAFEGAGWVMNNTASMGAAFARMQLGDIPPEQRIAFQMFMDASDNLNWRGNAMDRIRRGVVQGVVTDPLTVGSVVAGFFTFGTATAATTAATTATRTAGQIAIRGMIRASIAGAAEGALDAGLSNAFEQGIRTDEIALDEDTTFQRQDEFSWMQLGLNSTMGAAFGGVLGITGGGARYIWNTHNIGARVADSWVGRSFSSARDSLTSVFTRSADPSAATAIPEGSFARTLRGNVVGEFSPAEGFSPSRITIHGRSRFRTITHESAHFFLHSMTDMVNVADAYHGEIASRLAAQATINVPEAALLNAIRSTDLTTLSRDSLRTVLNQAGAGNFTDNALDGILGSLDDLSSPIGTIRSSQLRNDLDSILQFLNIAGDTPQARLNAWNNLDRNANPDFDEQFANAFESYMRTNVIHADAPAGITRSLSNARQFAGRILSSERGLSDDMRQLFSNISGRTILDAVPASGTRSHRDFSRAHGNLAKSLTHGLRDIDMPARHKEQFGELMANFYTTVSLRNGGSVADASELAGRFNVDLARDSRAQNWFQRNLRLPRILNKNPLANKPLDLMPTNSNDPDLAGLMLPQYRKNPSFLNRWVYFRTMNPSVLAEGGRGFIGRNWQAMTDWTRISPRMLPIDATNNIYGVTKSVDQVFGRFDMHTHILDLQARLNSNIANVNSGRMTFDQAKTALQNDMATFARNNADDLRKMSAQIRAIREEVATWDPVQKDTTRHGPSEWGRALNEGVSSQQKTAMLAYLDDMQLMTNSLQNPDFGVKGQHISGITEPSELAHALNHFEYLAYRTHASLTGRYPPGYDGAGRIVENFIDEGLQRELQEGFYISARHNGSMISRPLSNEESVLDVHFYKLAEGLKGERTIDVPTQNKIAEMIAQEVQTGQIHEAIYMLRELRMRIGYAATEKYTDSWLPILRTELGKQASQPINDTNPVTYHDFAYQAIANVATSGNNPGGGKPKALFGTINWGSTGGQRWTDDIYATQSWYWRINDRYRGTNLQSTPGFNMYNAWRNQNLGDAAQYMMGRVRHMDSDGHVSWRWNIPADQRTGLTANTRLLSGINNSWWGTPFRVAGRAAMASTLPFRLAYNHLGSPMLATAVGGGVLGGSLALGQEAIEALFMDEGFETNLGAELINGISYVPQGLLLAGMPLAHVVETGGDLIGLENDLSGWTWGTINGGFETFRETTRAATGTADRTLGDIWLTEGDPEDDSEERPAAGPEETPEDEPDAPVAPATPEARIAAAATRGTDAIAQLTALVNEANQAADDAAEAAGDTPSDARQANVDEARRLANEAHTQTSNVILAYENKIAELNAQLSAATTDAERAIIAAQMEAEATTLEESIEEIQELKDQAIAQRDELNRSLPTVFRGADADDNGRLDASELPAATSALLGDGVGEAATRMYYASTGLMRLGAEVTRNNPTMAAVGGAGLGMFTLAYFLNNGTQGLTDLGWGLAKFGAVVFTGLAIWAAFRPGGLGVDGIGELFSEAAAAVDPDGDVLPSATLRNADEADPLNAGAGADTVEGGMGLDTLDADRLGPMAGQISPSASHAPHNSPALAGSIHASPALAHTGGFATERNPDLGDNVVMFAAQSGGRHVPEDFFTAPAAARAMGIAPATEVYMVNATTGGTARTTISPDGANLPHMPVSITPFEELAVQ